MSVDDAGLYGDSLGDLKSSLTTEECGSGLNLFSSGGASSDFVAGGGEEDDGDGRAAMTPSPPDPDDFLCNFESSLDFDTERPASLE